MAMAAGGEAAVQSTLDEMKDLVSAHDDLWFKRLFTTAMIAKGKRREVLEKAFRGRISDLMLRFLLVLNANDRLGHFRGIADGFNEMLEEHRGRTPVEVITAGALGHEQVEMIKSRIQAVLGREPILHQSVDPRMIGGLKIKLGDRLIDGSVAGRMRRMRHALLTQGDADIRQRAETIAT